MDHYTSLPPDVKYDLFTVLIYSFKEGVLDTDEPWEGIQDHTAVNEGLCYSSVPRDGADPKSWPEFGLLHPHKTSSK